MLTRSILLLKKYDEKADIYALGVILVEMYCPPFKTQMERICTLSKLRSNWLPPHITEAYPDEVSDTACICLLHYH